ncbi:hypothetical protein ADK67_27530 [Saccharothrix sp. NRRL B-16348]|jgi:hypothetical protein|uniref:hypothetical protein n=1 Tax=Saccharothrix sp. NRRL B-16348 TaxID=1415542 RepID=UPI0006AE39EC|nr:hypothetical protein [Saccharothrix sp. NRRL B-16348]KOX21422.1 hypothetical protein ADK67_27530 [Saccharothrix sp. NRRL B-16348]
MFKKAGAVAIAAAGLMMLGSPAFATPHYDDDGGHYTAIGELNSYVDYEEGEGGDYADQFGLINFAQDSDLLSNINLCELEVNVLAIPILSNNDESVCINTDNDDNDDNG